MSDTTNRSAEHEWTQPRQDILRTDGEVSAVVWRATESGIVMDGELIGFPEAAREMIKLRNELTYWQRKFSTTSVELQTVKNRIDQLDCLQLLSDSDPD